MPVDVRVTTLALAAAVAMSALAAPAAAIELPTRQAQIELVDMLEREALYRDRVDWPEIRAHMSAAQDDPEKIRDVLKDAIDRSSGGHGAWMSAEQMHARGQRIGRVNAAAAAAAGAPATAVDAPRLDPRIGRVGIGGFAVVPGPTGQQQMRERASRWQAEIREQDNDTRCGWIVDLRGNTGGNMWPMLLGAAPLLRTAEGDDQTVGGFVTTEGPSLWQLTASGVRLGTRVIVDLGAPGFTLKRGGAPVAVLTGPRTASSGEATVLAFRGRPDTRSFGEPTRGVSTANVVRRLVDGSSLVLTTSVMQDRNGHGDGLKIEPDQYTGGDAATVAAAQAWLLAQPACSGG
ncbi:S41 family peptidase [Stenotrophomonas sp. 24(2023)]|uniref:S41 family peptidase n=1 Tax=Stenotrophomonas sp. 24(2023) TaxID=3068324 RepID=UPI0027E04FCF|nr:S41 family peptidase [Stenotrophomonas sp. 24(2023)]WMJ70490.1 S41 family peptidase [Stenotrophomonas sp. 24(2023)]